VRAIFSAARDQHVPARRSAPGGGGRIVQMAGGNRERAHVEGTLFQGDPTYGKPDRPASGEEREVLSEEARPFPLALERDAGGESWIVPSP